MGPQAEKYKQAVETTLGTDDGLRLVLGVYNRLLQREKAGTLEGDEVMRLAVLRKVSKERMSQ